MKSFFGNELARLKALKKVNKNIRDKEIIILTEEIKYLEDYIKKSRLRMDALRLIWKKPQLINQT